MLKWWLVYLAPQRDVTVDTFNGLLSFDSKDWLIGKYLYVSRSYEAKAIQDTIMLLRKEGYLSEATPGAVLDIGANIGMISIALLKHGYFRRAIAFEPAPTSYRLLVQNIHQNGLSERILCFPWALSNRQRESELELSADNSGNHRLRMTTSAGVFREQWRKTISVPVRVLDEVFTENPGLSNETVSLIWLDIEGHEGYFFWGARTLLQRAIPVVAEFWPYAMHRSGISQSEYCQIVCDLFTNFYVLAKGHFYKHRISDIESLFSLYRSPRQMCQIVLVNDRQIVRGFGCG